MASLSDLSPSGASPLSAPNREPHPLLRIIKNDSDRVKFLIATHLGDQSSSQPPTQISIRAFLEQELNLDRGRLHKCRRTRRYIRLLTDQVVATVKLSSSCVIRAGDRGNKSPTSAYYSQLRKLCSLLEISLDRDALSEMALLDKIAVLQLFLYDHGLTEHDCSIGTIQRSIRIAGALDLNESSSSSDSHQVDIALNEFPAMYGRKRKSIEIDNELDRCVYRSRKLGANSFITGDISITA